MRTNSLHFSVALVRSQDADLTCMICHELGCEWETGGVRVDRRDGSRSTTVLGCHDRCALALGLASSMISKEALA